MDIQGIGEEFPTRCFLARRTDGCHVSHRKQQTVCRLTGPCIGAEKGLHIQLEIPWQDGEPWPSTEALKREIDKQVLGPLALDSGPLLFACDALHHLERPSETPKDLA